MTSISGESAVAYQVSLLTLSLSVLLTRVYVRIVREAGFLRPSDYLAVVGWLITLGWVICSGISFQMGALDADPGFEAPVALLKLFYVSNFFFDIGLFFPKFSIVAFYWNIIPHTYRKLRRALYILVIYISLACICAVGIDTFWCLPISDNWSLTNQEASVWNSWVVFRTNYSFNISADIFVFILPFFILSKLTLPPRQKKSLIGIFSLGLITMIISVSRFAWENLNLDVASGDVWCTAELCVALIVVSLPSLGFLLRDRSSDRAQSDLTLETIGSVSLVTYNVNTDTDILIRKKHFKEV